MSGEIFSEDVRPALSSSEKLLLDLDGYEGPIDVLLELSRDQKLDLTKISILALADQYLEFVQEARRLRLELAADYLVMAAWLAYLKSRLLLPDLEEGGEEPSGAEMAAALKFQLQRLQAMRDGGEALVSRPQLGYRRLVRGQPDVQVESRTVTYEATFYDLLKAYAATRQRSGPRGLKIVAMNLYSVDQALERLSSLVGKIPGWQRLSTFLPPELRDNLTLRSAIASTFVASLELCKSGKLDIRQDGTYSPIFLRAADRDDAGPEPSDVGE
ncbi:segregation and condensation protein A [Rhodovibrionaceae bacterium A322]